MWDAITMKDYEKFKREEERNKMKRRQGQENMREFLENQMKELEFKKSMAQSQESNAHEQVLIQLKQYDTQANNQYFAKKKLLENQNKQNTELLKRKTEKVNREKAQSLLVENIHNRDAIKQVKVLERKQLFNVSKLKEDRQRDLMEDQSIHNIQKSSTKMFTKMEHMSVMNQEYDLFSKNQERHNKIIKDLVHRNDSIYNNVQASPYKNYTIIQNERDRKLEDEANNSFMHELQRRNKLTDEMNQKKAKELRYLGQTHKKQMNDKMTKIRHNSSIEKLDDIKMLHTLSNYEHQLDDKERMQEVNRRKMCRQYQTETKNAGMSVEPNFTREFELNKSLLREASVAQNNSSLF
jgi:hypothetical protein